MFNIKKILAGLFAALLASLFLTAAEAATFNFKDYFPLKDGAFWLYDNAFFDQIMNKMRTQNGDRYFLETRKVFTSIWEMKAEDDKIMLVRMVIPNVVDHFVEFSPGLVIGHDSMEVGALTTFEADEKEILAGKERNYAGKSRIEIAIKGVEDAGGFRDCLAYEMTITFRQAGEEKKYSDKMWLAKNKGTVKRMTGSGFVNLTSSGAQERTKAIFSAYKTNEENVCFIGAGFADGVLCGSRGDVLHQEGYKWKKTGSLTVIDAGLDQTSRFKFLDPGLMLKENDKIELEVTYFPETSKSVLFKLAQNDIYFKPLEEDGRPFYMFSVLRKTLSEERVFENMLYEIKGLAPYADDVSLEFVPKGRFKGMTLRQVFEKVQRKDLEDFFNYALKNQFGIRGKVRNLVDSFGTWVMEGKAD